MMFCGSQGSTKLFVSETVPSVKVLDHDLAFNKNGSYGDIAIVTGSTAMQTEWQRIDSNQKIV